MERYACNVCKFTYPATEFHKYDIKVRVYTCKDCSKTNTMDAIRRNVNNCERFRKTKPISITDVRLVFKKYNYASCISKANTNLTIARYYLDVPLYGNIWNAVVVTSGEKAKLPRKDQKRRSAMFPDQVRLEMELKEKI